LELGVFVVERIVKVEEKEWEVQVAEVEGGERVENKIAVCLGWTKKERSWLCA